MIPETTPMTPTMLQQDVDVNYVMPSKTYKFNFDNYLVSGTVDEREALIQAIIKILSTDRYAYAIYDGNYGHEFSKLIGKPYDFIIVELPRMIKEALLTDDRITDINDFRFSKLSIDTISVKFNVLTIFGEVNIETELII